VNTCTDLSQFHSITLDQTAAIYPGNRQDTKFLFNQRLLSPVLNSLSPRYRILEISGKRLFGYQNHYLDTPDFSLYLQHHNGRLPRYKIRFRQYVDTGGIHMEIKEKTNRSRTVKLRTVLSDAANIPDVWYGNDPEVFEFKQTLTERTGLKPDQLRPVLEINFSRLTLVNIEREERITIDTRLQFKSPNKQTVLDSLVAAEIKQSRYDPGSPFVRCMRSLSIQETRFSKYCFGIVEHEPIKYNRFKPRKRLVQKLMES